MLLFRDCYYPLICLEIITVLIFDLITVLDFMDYSGEHFSNVNLHCISVLKMRE
jgi:hypothetical protein